MNTVAVATILFFVGVGMMLFIGPEIWHDVKGIKQDLSKEYQPEPMRPMVKSEVKEEEETQTEEVKDDE